MARLRDEITPESTTPPPAGTATDKRKRRRITVYCNDDGSPDLSTISDEQKAALGLNGSAAGPAPEPVPQVEPIDPAIFGMMFGVLANIEAAVVAPKMGIDPDAARSALVPPPPLADALANAAAKVAAKYGGTLGRWADEIALGSLIVTWQIGAFAQMRSMQPVRKFDPPPPPPDKHESTESKPAPKPAKVENGSGLFPVPPSTSPIPEEGV